MPYEGSTGTSEGVPYERFSALVMELVEGEDLSRRIARGAIPIDEALPIARQIAEALEAAHDQGIIHRDLKPANIKVRPDGTVKVLDFGLAKAIELADPQGSAPQAATITTPAMTVRGMILGTAAYMSPEQAKGHVVDKRADIWAFGCVLYEMLTGKKAFTGQDVTDTLTSVMRDTPDWSALPATTPAAIRTLLRRCIERDLRKRAPHIAVARYDIEGAITSTGDLVHGSAPMPRWRPRRVTGVVLATAVALVAGWSAGRYAAPRPLPGNPVRFQVDAPPDAPFKQGAMTFLAVSPDGTRLAYIGQPRGRPSAVWLHSFTDGTSRELANTTGASNMFWSPDGRHLAFQTPAQLKRVDVSSGTVQTICSTRGSGSGAWNQDGIILLPDQAIQRVPAAGGTPEAITTVDTAKGDVRHLRPRFLPDGRRFLFTALNREADKSTLHLGELGSATTRILGEIGSGADYVQPGYLIHAQKGRLIARPFDAAAGQWAGDPIVVSDSVRQQATGQASFATTMSGVLAFDPSAIFSEPVDLTWVARGGGPAGLFAHLDGGHVMAMAADENTVAVEENIGAEGNTIWLLDGKRGTRTRATFDKGIQAHPVWSPDGTRFVYLGGPAGAMRLWIKTANGTGEPEALTPSDLQGPGNQQATDWSRDGRIVVYEEQNRDTGLDLKYVDLTGDRRPAVAIQTPFDERLGQLSPDGRLLAYDASDSGRSEVYVATFPDGAKRWSISNRGGAKPRWSFNGRELVFVDSVGVLQSVAIDRTGEFRAGVPTPLFSLGGIETDGFNYALSRDGTRVLVMRPSAQGPQPRMSVILNWPATLTTR